MTSSTDEPTKAPLADRKRLAAVMRSEPALWYAVAAVFILVAVISIACGYCDKTLDSYKNRIEILEKVVSILAILIGGAWAFWRFGVTREAEWNLDVKLETEFLPIQTTGCRLLVVRIRICNIGKVAFFPGSDGITLKVKSYDSSKFEAVKRLDETANPVPFLIKVLRWYDTTKYIIEPGAEYCEIEAIIVEENKIISLIAKVHGPDTSIDAETFVSTFPVEKKAISE